MRKTEFAEFALSYRWRERSDSERARVVTIAIDRRAILQVRYVRIKIL